LPDRVVGVLDGKVREGRVFAGAESLVEESEFADEDAD
jgi:hypothetical protein